MEATCPLCNEAITNPICPECIEQWVKDWLGENKEEMQQVEIITESFAPLSPTSVNCIICNKPMNVCAHCYAKEVREVIDRKEEFSYLFNFHLTA